MSAALNSLAEHVLAMADDAYLVGHPEWVEIVEEARKAIGADIRRDLDHVDAMIVPVADEQSRARPRMQYPVARR